MKDTTRRDALARSIATLLPMLTEPELDRLDRELVEIIGDRDLKPANDPRDVIGDGQSR